MSFEPLKNSLNKTFFQAFFDSWKKLEASFDKQKMEYSIFDASWNGLELKERTRKLSTSIEKQMPADYKKACTLLINILIQLENQGEKVGSYEYLFIPDFIEVYGQKHVEISLNAIEEVTKFITCEFAIRPLIVQNKSKVLKKMLLWSTHPHQNVRRLASEGCRPKLPWGMALKELIKEPKEILPILENLKNDDSLFVRKSVANNLNDISKDHPNLVINLMKKWQGYSANTDWIIKHACRSLLKAGNQDTMKLFGYADNKSLVIGKIELLTSKVKMGSALSFKFQLQNKSEKENIIRLEYGIYFLKSNGKQNRKVFKLSEKSYKAKERTTITKSHIIKPITTRKYYLGEQKLSLIVNGVEIDQTKFTLN